MMKASPRHLFSTLMLILALTAATAATPIQPDLEKLLSKPHSEQEGFAPARAGWDGPETEPSGFSQASLVLDKFGPAETARITRESFLATAIPDPRIWACLCILILFLRRLRRTTLEPAEASESNVVESGRAA
jgi:hypothetical protein